MVNQSFGYIDGEYYNADGSYSKSKTLLLDSASEIVSKATGGWARYFSDLVSELEEILANYKDPKFNELDNDMKADIASELTDNYRHVDEPEFVYFWINHDFDLGFDVDHGFRAELANNYADHIVDYSSYEELAEYLDIEPDSTDKEFELSDDQMDEVHDIVYNDELAKYSLQTVPDELLVYTLPCYGRYYT